MAHRQVSATDKGDVPDDDDMVSRGMCVTFLGDVGAFPVVLGKGEYKDCR